MEAVLASLRAHLDPEAAAAIEKLNASLNARLDLLTHAVQGPSPWLDVGRALVAEVGGPSALRRTMLPPPGDAEEAAAATRLCAAERGRTDREKVKKLREKRADVPEPEPEPEPRPEPEAEPRDKAQTPPASRPASRDSSAKASSRPASRDSKSSSRPPSRDRPPKAPPRGRRATKQAAPRSSSRSASSRSSSATKKKTRAPAPKKKPPPQGRAPPPSKKKRRKPPPMPSNDAQSVSTAHSGTVGGATTSVGGREDASLPSLASPAAKKVRDDDESTIASAKTLPPVAPKPRGRSTKKKPFYNPAWAPLEAPAARYSNAAGLPPYSPYVREKPRTAWWGDTPRRHKAHADYVARNTARRTRARRAAAAERREHEMLAAAWSPPRETTNPDLIWVEGARSPSREPPSGRFGSAADRSASLPALPKPPPMPAGYGPVDAPFFARPDTPGDRDIAVDTRPAPLASLWTDPDRDAKAAARRDRSRSPSPAAPPATPVMKDVWHAKRWVPHETLPDDAQETAVSPLKAPPLLN